MKPRLLSILLFSFFFFQVGHSTSTEDLVNDVYVTIDLTLCEGDIYMTPEGREFSAEGTYLDTFMISPTCDSIRTLQLAFFPVTPDAVSNMTLCEGETIIIGEIKITASGTYYLKSIDENGCEYQNILIAQFVTKSADIINNLTFCENSIPDPYSESGTYITEGIDCGPDTIYNISIIPFNSANYTEFVEICDGQEYRGYDETGVYVIEEISAEGCIDSTFLYLTVADQGNPTTTEVSIEICQGEIYMGHTEPGIYIDTLSTTSGCDSILVLDLSFFEPTPDIETTECVPPTDPTTPGIYTVKHIDENGCPYFEILTVIIAPENVTIDTTICEGEVYLGQSDTGVYTITTTDEDGCVYDVFLYLDVIPLVDCDVATEELRENHGFAIYPNPVSDILHIDANINQPESAILQVYDLTGREVLSTDITAATTVLGTSGWLRGSYIVVLSTDRGRYSTRVTK